jgi:hypothetical protein
MIGVVGACFTHKQALSKVLQLHFSAAAAAAATAVAAAAAVLVMFQVVFL